MFKLAQARRTAHTKQKPKPRLVTKAHRLEQDELLAAAAAVARPTVHRKDKTPAKN